MTTAHMVEGTFAIDAAKGRMQDHLAKAAMYWSEGDDANAQFEEGMYEDEKQNMIDMKFEL